MTLPVIPGWVRIALLVIAGIAIGATAQGWRKNAVIADLQRDSETGRADRAETALDTLNTAINKMNTAAGDYIIARDNLRLQMDAITKELKNVQAKNPLPVDCRPDAGRLRSLQAAVDAANRAAAGQ